MSVSLINGSVITCIQNGVVYIRTCIRPDIKLKIIVVITVIQTMKIQIAKIVNDGIST